MKKLLLIAALVLSMVGGAGQASADPIPGVSWEDTGIGLPVDGLGPQ